MAETIALVYVLAASRDPDHVRCQVPYQVNERLIFFGACKKALRRQLQRRYLLDQPVVDLPDSDRVYVVGINGANARQVRKIVWAGRVRRLLTFEAAYNRLAGPEFQPMRSHRQSPLHLAPVYEGGDFAGYQHVSSFHAGKDRWVTDVTDSRRLKRGEARVEGDLVLRTPDVDRRQAFPLDCCFLADNLFFARGVGIPITADFVALLRRAQPERRRQVNAYALFGTTRDGNANGLRGTSLKLAAGEAQSLIDLIETHRPPQPELLDAPPPVSLGC